MKMELLGHLRIIFVGSIMGGSIVFVGSIMSGSIREMFMGKGDLK